jgi:hypothetical protein
MSTKGRRWREGHAKLAKPTSLAGLAGRGEHAGRRVVEAYKLQGDQDDRARVADVLYTLVGTVAMDARIDIDETRLGRPRSSAKGERRAQRTGAPAALSRSRRRGPRDAS